MKLKAVRGTKDIFALDSKKYNYIVENAKEIFENYGFNRIITPIFEETQLFKRGIGEGTDIVDKEMYTFEDRGGRSCTLRPEGTAPVVRAYLEHKIYGVEDLTRWYYHGSMFRYERPQAGRYREFNQLGVEVLGKKDPMVDAEIIAMGYKLLEKLNLEELEVQINTIGGNESRSKYRKALVNYLSDKKDDLCTDCQNRYEKNPLRVLDCKIDTNGEVVSRAPVLSDYLNEEEVKHFEEVKKYLEIFKVKYKVNPKLVRGLDYYSNTVFEVVTNKLGAQGTVLAGGRYDNLVSQMGGKDTPAFGFAAGIERLMLLLDEKILDEKIKAQIIWLGEGAKEKAFVLAQELRLGGIEVGIEYENKSMKAQMKKADKSNAKYALILGEEEVNNNKVIIKDLKDKDSFSDKMNFVEGNNYVKSPIKQNNQKEINIDKVLEELRGE